MNGLWVWVLYLCLGGIASFVGCSYIATNLGPHRAQRNMGLCVDIDLLWYTYKANTVSISTSQDIYLYVQLLVWMLHMLFTSMAGATLCDLPRVIGHH